MILLLGHYQAEQLAENFRRHAEPSWRNLWQSLSPLAQTLLSLPLKSEAPAIIKREYQNLVQLGILEVDGNGRYQHFSQGFADWIKQETKSQNLIQKLREHLNTQ